MKIKLNLKLLNKLTAILVVGCFFVSSVCRDAIAAAATPTMNAQEFKQIFTDFMLPYSYGKISGSHFAGTDRVVINIQDLHCHPQVQKSINDIIEMFDNKYGVSNVYLEGACGDISAKPFLKNLTNITEKNEILDKLLQSGRLTGAEYYSATTNKTEIIKGLEKKDPYLENLKRFGNLLEVQDQIASILKGVEESTQKVKKQYYTRRQYKIEKLSKDYLEGKIKAEKYYRLLAKHTEKLGIDLTKYENTFLYMQLLALQSELDYKAITKQLQTLVFLLKENLPPNAYQILLDNTKNFEQTDKLYAYIIKLSKSFGLDLDVNFKELDKYFNFIELSQKINPLELLKEEENLTREINTRFSDTIAQREVVFLTNFEKYLKDYLSTKITSDDYEYYKENIETYKKLWNKYVDNKVLTLLEPYMKETDKFYKINTDRNNYFTENIFNGVETEKIENIKEEPDEVSKIIENMDKVKRVDIIITGGFHSQTVSEILKQHGISYIVITPNVQDGVKEAEKTYYQIAKQQREINFQTLAARIVLDLFGDENLSQIARIKVLKDYNLSKQEVRDIIGTNVENSLLEDIFSLTDEEFIKKYNPRYDNDLQDVFDNTSVVNGLINVAEQLESDDISPANFKKLTEIIAKEYGISNEQEIEQIAQKAIKIIENGENSSILDAFTNIFKSGNQDVVLTILEVYNNYNPKTVDYFLDDKENKFEYDKEKGLYKFKNDKKIYLKDYKIVDEVPMESSKESKKLEQQEISTERKFYKEMEEKIENFDFSLNRPNRNIVEENIKNLNVIIDEISISELLNDEERISLTKKLEDKVVDLIYPKDNKKEGLNILRKSTKNALIPGNVITTSMFVKDILESKLSDEVKFEIIEGVDVNDIEDNRTKNKVLEIKEQIEKGKAVLETGLEEKAKENLRLNLQNLEAKEEQYLRDKEEQLRLEKEKEDLEKSSQKNIDKTNKEKQTSSLLELVTPQFSSKGAAALGAEEKQIENLSRLMDSTIFTIYDNIKYFFKFDLKYNSIREQIQQMIQDGEIEILNFNTINDFSFKYDGKTWIISEDKTLVEVPMAGQGLKMVRTKEEMLKEWHRNKISEEIGPTFNSLISEKAQNKLVQLSIDGKLTKEIIENFNEFIRSSILNGRSKIYYDKEKDDFYYEENNKPKKDRKKIYFETFVQEQNEQKNQKKALRIKAKKILDGYGFKFEEEEIDRIAEVFALVGESIFDELINEYSSIYIKNVCDIIIDDDVENIVWILNFFIGKYSRRDKKNIFLNLFENSEKSKKVCKSLWDAAKNIDNVGNFDDFIKKMNLMTSAMTPDQFSKFLNIILEADEETNKNLFDLLSRAGSTFKEYFLNLGWEQNDLNKFLIRFGMLGDEEKEIILKSNTQRSESFINVLTRLDDNEFKKIQNLFEIILHKFEYDNVYGFFVLKIFCNKNFIEKFEKHPIFKDLNDKDKTIQIYKRAGAFWLFLKELNENEELRNYLGLEYYIDLNELLEEENSETLNNLMNEFFNIYNDLEKTKIYRKNMKVIGVAHTEEGEPGFNGRRFMFNSIKKVNDLLGLNLNYHGTLFKLGYCGDPDIISIDDPIDLKEQLSQSIKENINAKEGLLIAFTGHGSVDGLWLSGSDDNNKNLGPNANKITPDEFVKMFCDKNGNPLEKDLSNVVINLGSCHSYYYAKNLIEEFRKAGFEKMPIIISAAGQETVFGYTVFETDENGIATSGRADNFDEGLINYWREYNLKGELTAKDILLAESYIRNSNSSLFVSNENNLNAYEKVVNILSKNDSIKKQTNYAEKADYQTSKQNVSDYTFKDATVMLSIFNTIKKHLENKDWNNEKGIRKFIFKAVSFLDKTAPVWEELIFGVGSVGLSTLMIGSFVMNPLLSLPLILFMRFVVFNGAHSIVEFVLNKWFGENYNIKQNFMNRLRLSGKAEPKGSSQIAKLIAKIKSPIGFVSAPYIIPAILLGLGFSAFSPVFIGITAISTLGASVLHYWNNKYGRVRLSIFDNLKNLLKGKSDKEINNILVQVDLDESIKKSGIDEIFGGDFKQFAKDNNIPYSTINEFYNKKKRNIKYYSENNVNEKEFYEKFENFKDKGKFLKTFDGFYLGRYYGTFYFGNMSESGEISNAVVDGLKSAGGPNLLGYREYTRYYKDNNNKIFTNSEEHLNEILDDCKKLGLKMIFFVPSVLNKEEAYNKDSWTGSGITERELVLISKHLKRFSGDSKYFEFVFGAHDCFNIPNEKFLEENIVFTRKLANLYKQLFSMENNYVDNSSTEEVVPSVNATVVNDVKLLRKTINPIGALTEIAIEFSGTEEQIDSKNVLLYDSEKESIENNIKGVACIPYKIERDPVQITRGTSVILKQEGEEKAHIRLEYKGGMLIVGSKDGIGKDILNDEEIEYLIKQVVKEGIKTNIKVFEKIKYLAFAIEGEDVIDTMNNEILDSSDSVTPPTENIYRFNEDEKIDNNTISGIKNTGFNTFEVSEYQYAELSNKELDCKFIVRKSNVGNNDFDNIEEKKQSGIFFDFSKENIENPKKKLKDIEEQKGKSKKAMNLTVYVKFNSKDYENLRDINIFEQYGIIPVVVDLESAERVNGKKMLDVENMNNIKEIEDIKKGADIFGLIFDKNSADKLGDTVIGGIKTIIEYFTNDKSTYSPQAKFKTGLNKAFNLNKVFNSNRLTKSNGSAYDCKISDIKVLKDLLGIDITQEDANDKIKDQFNDLNLDLFTDDAKKYIVYLIGENKDKSENYIEALGFIRGVAMNTIATEISTSIDNINIIGNIEDNEIQGVLIWTIQNILKDKEIKDLYKNNTEYFETKSTEEFFESMRLELNKIFAENEYRINVPETIAEIEDIPFLLMNDYRGEEGVEEVRISANIIKAMLAAA